MGIRKNGTDNDKRAISNKYYAWATMVRCFVGWLIPVHPNKDESLKIPRSMEIVVASNDIHSVPKGMKIKLVTVSPQSASKWTELLKKLESGCKGKADVWDS